MQTGLKVHSWEWILVDTIDRRGRPCTKRVRVPREYTEIQYEEPEVTVEELDEDEEWIDF